MVQPKRYKHNFEKTMKNQTLIYWITDYGRKYFLVRIRIFYENDFSTLTRKPKENNENPN